MTHHATPPRRRWPRSEGAGFDRLMYVLLFAFVAVALGPALLGRGTLLDVDALSSYRPFQAVAGSNLSSAIACRGDTFDYYMPGIAAIKHGFLAGHFPTWAPYEVGGTPLASLPNHASLSPLSLPYYVLPLWLAPAFVKLAEMAVAIGGMVALLRRHGISRGASVLAGLLFASSGFMMMWTNWPHTKVAAFIPALLWALERTVQQRRARDVALVAVVVASMLLGGFPAVTLFALTLGGVYVLVRAVTASGRRLRPTLGIVLRSACGVLLGVGLSAVQILPFVRELGAFDLSARQATVVGAHVPLGLFASTVAPDVSGLCVGGEAYSPLNPIEGVGFLGAAAVVLAVLALVVRRPLTGSAVSLRRIAAVAIVVVVLLVWVGGPLLVGLQQLPLFSSNSIRRAQSVFGFLGAVLAALGLEVLLRRARAARAADPDPDPDPVARRPALRTARLVTGGLVLALVLGFGTLVLLAERSDARREGYLDHADGALVVPGVLLLVAVAGVLLALAGPRRLRWVGPVVLVLAAVGQSATFAHTVLPLSSRSNFYPVTPTHAFLQAHIGEDRYAAGDDTMLPATSDWYHLRTPVGHEFTSPAWKQLLLAIDPLVAQSRTYSEFSSRVSLPVAGASPLLDQLAVRYWVSAPGDVDGRAVPGTGSGDGSVELGPGQTLRCSVPGGALRAVGVRVARPASVPLSSPARLEVVVHTPRGDLVGSRALGSEGRLSGAARTAVLGEDLPAGGRYRVDVRATGLREPLVLQASGGSPLCSAVRPVRDGLRLVSASAGANVWRRDSALPRIRWASRSAVIPDADQRVARLTSGVPDDTVLLDDSSTPAADGGSARVRVVADDPERVSTDVTAQGRGYLVVADALVRQGWSATVDGRRTPLVQGNHALAAVPVPAGRHRVVLSYAAPGLAQGTVVSGVSVLVVLGLLVVPWARRRRRETISSLP